MRKTKRKATHIQPFGSDLISLVLVIVSMLVDVCTAKTTMSRRVGTGYNLMNVYQLCTVSKSNKLVHNVVTSLPNIVTLS